MTAEMEKLVALCQQLQAGAKTPAQGKTATFQKVWELQPCVCSALRLQLLATDEKIQTPSIISYESWSFLVFPKATGVQ